LRQEGLLSHKKGRTDSENLAEILASKAGFEGASGSGEIRPEEKSLLEDRLKEAETKAQENYDRLLRVTAEFENYKKRMDREMNEFRKFANDSIVKDILPTVDNLQRALESSAGNDKDMVEAMRAGVEMTLKGLMEALEKYAVLPIESVGKPFDPNFHHAVMQEESREHGENMVSQELQKGYLMNDRLLRPAMVVVSKKPAPQTETRTDESKNEEKIKVKIR
jgi:molecular chaperone GrpE